MEIGWLAFSEILCGVRGPYGDVCDRAQLFWKNSVPTKMTKNGQKYSKNVSFLIFRIVLSRSGPKWKYLWPFSILEKPPMWKKFGSQVMPRNALGQSDFSIL